MAALRLAHRGDWRHAPENSLAALLAAVRLPGVDGVEFDVRAAADGLPVLAHDADLRRLYGDARPVGALPAGELAELGVCALDQALAALPAGAFLDIELKEEIAPAVVPLLSAARGPEGRAAVVSSFLPAALEGVARLAPAWPRWLISVALDATVVRIARELGCRGIAAQWPALTPAAVGLARRAGLELAAWTVRRRPTRIRLERYGLAAVVVEGAALAD
ncbi:MAG TPA: glycerophosphodiester phosphodiesterase [Candidatus Limnocylindrales bacterium]|nr:glycerophosphodiester phosphodiesterase [Candidatus Limnocylindrales bacterium]